MRRSSNHRVQWPNGELDSPVCSTQSMIVCRRCKTILERLETPATEWSQMITQGNEAPIWMLRTSPMLKQTSRHISPGSATSLQAPSSKERNQDLPVTLSLLPCSSTSSKQHQVGVYHSHSSASHTTTRSRIVTFPIQVYPV